jgi:hypothetical protein
LKRSIISTKAGQRVSHKGTKALRGNSRYFSMRTSMKESIKFFAICLISGLEDTSHAT